MHLTKSFARRAFTLIEMLVVIALLLILLTVAAAMFPRFAENQRIVKAADQIQGWLLIAKQRAMRDRRPTGIRFLIDPATNTVKEMIYVQQVDDFTGGRYLGRNPNIPPLVDQRRGSLCDFTNVDLIGAAAVAGAPDQATVQAGDYIEFYGGGLVHEIWWVQPPQPPTRPLPTLWVHPRSSVPPATSSANYRIIRQPRPVAGEAPLQLPQNIVVDARPTRSSSVPIRRVYESVLPGNPNPADPGNYPPVTQFPDPDQYPRPRQTFAEILFAPGGGVVGQGTTTGSNIILWVRDVTKDDNVMEGSPLLVSIHTRTGLVAVHPVNTAGTTQAEWYQFTRDGRSSGL